PQVAQTSAPPPVPDVVTQEDSEAAAEPAPSQAVPMVLDNTAAAQSAAAPAAAHEEGATGNATRENAESFALNAGGQSGAHSVQPGNLSTTIIVGTIIPAVLETALNTDLPGNARAIVSRDVRSFDGSAVLIPRGS